MFSYFAYGLGLQSALAIPEFVAAEDITPDVTIEVEPNYHPANYIPENILNLPWSIKLNREESILYWKDIGIFLVQEGCKVVIMPVPGVTEQILRFCLVGTVMAVILYQRGLLVLHASVVNINGGAIAFLGVSGAGKSSTVATLQARGHGIVADDVAAVTWKHRRAVVYPGFPQLKLSPEMAVSLGYDFESLIPLHPDEEKRGYRTAQKFPRSPLPIRRLYVLADAPTFSLEPLSQQEAVIELVRHSRPTTLFHSGGASHFLQCTRLAKEFTLYRLNRPRDLDSLPDLAALIEQDIANDVSPILLSK